MEPSAGQLESTRLVERHFTTPGLDPFDVITWTRRDVWVGTKHEHLSVEAPDFWSDNAVGIVSKLYLSKAEGSRENSARELVERIVAKIVVEGVRSGYFGNLPELTDFDVIVNSKRVNFCAGLLDSEPAKIMYDELRHIMINQLAVFNSPVLFNVGRDDRDQQVSACFILGVDDTTESIIETSEREINIFRGGSGSGSDLSAMRASMEPLTGGGTSSGPVSFMRLWDAGAGTFKSGGKTRRAAILRKLDVDHPDIRDFITCKVREEKRLYMALDAGIDIGFSEEGERNVAEMTAFQNANNSVGVPDFFMERALDPSTTFRWALHARSQAWRDQHDGNTVVGFEEAEDLLDLIASSAHAAACPGMFFMDSIQRMHTTPMLDGVKSPIKSSNPCFPGETLVDTSEGRIRIDQLAELYATGQPLPFAFGWDLNDELPAMKRIRQATMTKMVTELVEVTTDKGVVFRCTPEHKILTRVSGRGPSGAYVEAQYLVPGQRLRKVGHATNANRSGRGTINHRATESAPRGTVWRAPWMWEQAYGPIPEGMEVHHINEDATDDRLSNFELIDSGTHQSFHSSGQRNGRFIEADEQILVETWEAIEATGNVSVARWNSYVHANGLKGTVPLGNYVKGIRGMSWQEFGEWIEARRGLVNDSVTSIVKIVLSEAVPVYDISVEDVHNFGVGTEGVEHSIVVSNCGEYLSNDDTSCNLGSINILQFVSTGTYGGKRRFDVDDFRQVVDVMTVSMDILVTLGYFPDPKIAERSGKLRQLGLGYSNMGAAIMAQGFAYDSDEGRDFAASVTALETGRIYRKSAEMAKLLGAFHYFDENSESMLGVIDKHIMSLPENSEAGSIWATAAFDWNIAAIQGREHGFRNAQASVIPPAGTTSFFLDCDTTGIEPAFMLVTHKELAGGGTMTLVNQSVTRAANALGGYSKENIEQMNAGDFSCCSPEDAAVFHTANEISPAGHIKMMAAVQPFVSGAISKTINMHEDATVEDVKAAYVLAWQLGCKDLAIYRNGSKARQPHSAKPKKEHKIVVEAPGLAGDEQTVTITGSPTGETTKIRIEDGQLKVEGSETVAYELMKSVDKIITPEELEAAVKAGKPGDGYDWIRKMNDDAFSKAVAGGPQVSQISPPARDRLAKTCLAKRHKIHLRGQMGDYEGYVHVGMYPNGRLGEMFISGFGRAGSFTVNALQAWATDFSIAIQYGIDWRTLARKHLGVSDETGGMVVPEPGASGTMPIRSAKSIFDYIVRFLALEFGDGDDHREFGVRSKQAEYDVSSDSIRIEHTAPLVVKSESNGHGHNPREIFGPRCTCGGMLRPTGGCFTCMSCAATTGCG